MQTPKSCDLNCHVTTKKYSLNIFWIITLRYGVRYATCRSLRRKPLLLAFNFLGKCTEFCRGARRALRTSRGVGLDSFSGFLRETICASSYAG